MKGQTINNRLKGYGTRRSCGLIVAPYWHLPGDTEDNAVRDMDRRPSEYGAKEC
jgi:hypothetical protein